MRTRAYALNSHAHGHDTCSIPYVVIVKKHYPNRRKVQTRRKWKLQQLAKVQEGGITKKDEEREANEYEMFMRDLEEDPELRATVNIYRGVSVRGFLRVRVPHGR